MSTTGEILRAINEQISLFNDHADDVAYQRALYLAIERLDTADLAANKAHLAVAENILQHLPDDWKAAKMTLTVKLAGVDDADKWLTKTNTEIPITTRGIIRNINKLSLSQLCGVVSQYSNLFTSGASRMILGYYITSYKSDIHKDYIPYMFMGMLLEIPKSILVHNNLPKPWHANYEKVISALDVHFEIYEKTSFSRVNLLMAVTSALKGVKCNKNNIIVKYIKSHLSLGTIYSLNSDLLTRSEKIIYELDEILK